MKKLINEDVKLALARLRLVLRRLEQDLAAGDYWRAQADLLELSETANRTWHLMSEPQK